MSLRNRIPVPALFLPLLLLSCIPEKPDVRGLPRVFLRAAGDILGESQLPPEGHLLRYLKIRPSGTRILVRSWDLFRLPRTAGASFPLPVSGAWQLYRLDPEGKNLTPIGSGSGSGTVWVGRRELSSRGYCLLFRSRTLDRDSPIRLLAAPDTRLVLVSREGRAGGPWSLALPAGYVRSGSPDAGSGLRIRREAGIGRGTGYLLFQAGGPDGKGCPPVVRRMRRRFAAGQPSPRLPRGKKAAAATRLKVSLLFQRACRSVDFHGPGFLSRESGMVAALGRIADGLRAARLPFSVAVPAVKKGGAPVPEPGIVVHLPQGPIWLFPHRRYAAAGEIPEHLRGRDCYLAGSRGCRLSSIPAPSRADDRVVLYTVHTGYRSGGAGLYLDYRLTGRAAREAREATGLDPALEAARRAFPRVFLPDHGIRLSRVRIKHRIPTHLPLQGMIRGSVSGVLDSRRDARLTGISLLRRRYGSFLGSWTSRGKGDSPLFRSVWSFTETTRLVLPRGVYAWKMPKTFSIRRGGLTYSGRWKYIPGRPYRKPRSWSLARWRRWQRTHYPRRKHTLLLYRSFRLVRAPRREGRRRALERMLRAIDEWERRPVRLRWK